MAEWGFAVVDASSPGAQWAMTQYFDELNARFVQALDKEAALAEAGEAYAPPRGVFVVAGATETPVACGALQFLDAERGEIKRMWVAPEHRGQGLATRLLDVLEGHMRDSGRSVSVLDTASALTPAIALYESRGYERVERYNDNPHAELWFRKQL